MKKFIKLSLIFIIMTLIIIVQIGCSKEKNVIILDDVCKKDSIVLEDKLKIEEKDIELNLDKGRIFLPYFWRNDKVVGMIKESGELDSLVQDKEKNFYEIDSNGNMNKMESKANFSDYRGEKGVAWKFHEGAAYYYDFTDVKTLTNKLICEDELFKEFKSSSKYYSEKFGGSFKTKLVEGNDKYMKAFSYISNKDEKKITSFIKIFDIEEKKLYESEALENTTICDVLYVKSLGGFITIDADGQIYKISTIDNKLKLDKYKKIDIGKGNKISVRDNIFLVEGDKIIIKNIGEVDEGGYESKVNIVMMTYDLSNGKVANVIKGEEKDDIRILNYHDKYGIALIGKQSLKNKMGISSVYIAKIKGNKVNYISKLDDYINDDEYCYVIDSIINESGDKLFIQRYISNEDKNNRKGRVIYEFCNIK